ncbi:MAG: NfeD family protein [Planctomycetota bacterium]|jgi:membrane-bound serine protease (ClpP class)|nr:NfeD family protein [Planctomycetota bacterium]MDP6764074.1 NfeD family protein [Planctomycetota bacterium]MDP6988393.1 NfeD family protein [Planctomycetota bacterium]
MTWAILLLGLGLVLIVAELLIPSFGLLGLSASLAIIAGGVFAWREDGLMVYMIASGVCVPTAVMAGFKLLPHSPLAKALMAEGLSTTDNRAVDPRDASLMGAQGEVLATLRPSGVARLDGRRVDVVSRGEMIEAGARVRVIELLGNRVVVAEADDDATEET